MTPRTFEDYLKHLIEENGRRTRADATVSVTLTEFGVTITGQVPGEGVERFRVQESRVEPVAFDSPSQGGSQ